MHQARLGVDGGLIAEQLAVVCGGGHHEVHPPDDHVTVTSQRQHGRHQSNARQRRRPSHVTKVSREDGFFNQRQPQRLQTLHTAKLNTFIYGETELNDRSSSTITARSELRKVLFWRCL